MKLTICHLYPDLLDLYGDRGNILTLQSRCRWRGIETLIQRSSLGDPLDFQGIDILFIGGGSDREQSLLVQDLKRREVELRQAVEDGLVVLTICGGYQLLGDYYQTAGGERIPGLGILNLWTIAGPKRLIGNVVVELNSEAFRIDDSNTKWKTLAGFENHSGKTYLGSGLLPLGCVKHGYGNNGEDGGEGVRYHNVFGTYLHGPLLPKNPHLADLLLQLALERRGFAGELQPLDDRLEELAHQVIVQRVLTQK
ncbi:MAG: type 1 glutamine amidotransferase [Desulfitobacteriaceae bacterium]